MKYHFVYEKGPEEKILELDTDQEPPEPGASIRLHSPTGTHRLRWYLVDDVVIDPLSKPQITIIIEVKPISRKKPA